MATTETTTSTKLRNLADLLDNHPDLPVPYISAMSSGNTTAHWYLHVHDIALEDQKTTAASIIRILGGHWDKRERSYDEALEFAQERDGVTLEVVVHRAAVCERVITGTREVTVPATLARAAEPERTSVVEDVEWVCSSLLAGTS